MPRTLDVTLLRLTAARCDEVLELDAWAFPSSHDVATFAQLPNPLSWDRTYGVVATGQPNDLVAMHSPTRSGAARSLGTDCRLPV